ncbi:hypothetical protein [Tumebacillus lipolyticus]|uniref:DUF4376 domain-containing protein n=1 Tax=Tumebacillus lipolyticus TaxID=1280370 RepID=A0ABW4ZRE9_9BACL
MAKLYYMPNKPAPDRCEVISIYNLPDDPSEGATPFIEVDVFPEPVYKKYKRADLYVNSQTSEWWFEYVDRPLTTEEQVEILQEQLKAELNKAKTADQRYRELNLTTTSIDQVKQAKIDQLNEACESEILRGFTSVTTGHFYAFGVYDQTNFTQQMLLLLAGTTVGDVTWQTEDAGEVDHSMKQFLAVCAEAEQHKRTKIRRYQQLKAQVKSADTWQHVDAITWS